LEQSDSGVCSIFQKQEGRRDGMGDPRDSSTDGKRKGLGLGLRGLVRGWKGQRAGVVVEQYWL